MRLNLNQERAVRTNHRRIGVVAGAGTGKTAVLTERCRRLIDAGTDPRRILVCTFTEKAAGELKARLGESAAVIGTLHSFCARVLRVMGDEIGFASDFTIYDDTDRVAVLEDAARDLGVNKGKPATLLKDDKIRRLFEDRMRAACAVTYDQLEALTVKALSSRLPEVFRFEHVLVDECQDLNPVQSRILKWLDPVNLFMVGDPRQSIYSFRGATPALFESYIEHEAVERIDLTTNYRSQAAIVELANFVMGRMPALSSGAPWERSSVAILGSAHSEGVTLAGEVLNHTQNNGLEHGDIAVLGRTWRCVRFAAAALREVGIPFRFYGNSDDPWEQPEGRTIARWLLMQDSPHDDNLAALVARQLFPGMEMGTQREAAGLERRSLWRHLCGLGILPPGGAFVPTETGSEANKQPTCMDLVETLAKYNLEVPQRIADDLRSHRRKTLRAFRYWWFYGRQTTDRVSADPTRVHLMTIHAAKGLEFEAVVMPWANYGVYPYFSSKDPEDRRVFYVGMTRARRYLTFTRQVYVNERTTSITPFLPKNLHATRPRSDSADPELVHPSIDDVRTATPD